MPDFGIFRGFGSKLFSDKLYAGQLPAQLGLIGSENALKYLLNLYPNAAAAYSLRKLRTAYTGSAIRVRRASDNAEQDIGFNGENLNTSALTAFCSGTNGFVKTWYDQSGNGNDATQTTSSNQPQIVSGGSVIEENGKPSLSFNGTNHALQTTSINLNQPLTLFVVNKYNTINTQILIGLSSTTSLYASVIVSSNFRIYYGNYLNGATADTNRHLFYSLANSSNSQIAIDGSGAIIGNAGTLDGNVIDIGYSSKDKFYSNSNTQEIIIYASNQSSNRTGISNNINSFYSIY